MSLPIADYALIGDTRTTALISRDGSVDWLCWPRHDSPALFLRLLDDREGGACSVEFAGAAQATRRYLPGTNILETSFAAASGRATLLDFMPVRPLGTPPEEGPDGDAESRLVRILRCDSGAMEGRFLVRPTFDYARRPCTPVPQADGSMLFHAGEHRLRVTGSHDAVVEGATVAVGFRLRPGEQAYLVLTQGEDGCAAPVEGPQGALDRLEGTRRY
jgi:hypothetical protein